jgi:signal peptidase I
MKKILIKSGKFLTSLILAFMIILLVLTIYNKLSGKQLSILGYSFSIVLTSSMDGTLNPDENGNIEQPVIKKNDFIITKKIDIQNIKIGDVILYKTKLENNLNLGIERIVHKVIAVNTDVDNNIYFTTKGTANELPDTEQVTDVLGIYLYSSSFLGSLFIFLLNPLNLVFVFILFAGIYISIRQIKNISKEVKNKKN